LLLLLLLLLTLLILQVCAVFSDFQEDMHLMACSDSDKEDMYGLTGEVMYYADFDKKKEVYTLPKFGDPIECPTCYGQAVGEQCHEGHSSGARPPWAPLLYPRDHLLPSKPNTLVCQASGFYPAPVNFTWTRDRLIIRVCGFPYPHGFPTRSPRGHARMLHVYYCCYSAPCSYMYIITVTAVQFQKPSLAPSVFCAVGLTLGLVGVAVGTFFLVKGNECR
uniref:Ig-like domain-containing protein n=1 Tax=Neogobius melanostomus TaxID=47308 RepID=A0A8C6WH50_9GOBI